MRLQLISVASWRCCLRLAAASASNFTVTPTEVNLSGSATSALVTLRNGGKTPLRFEVTLVSWSEDEHGKMTLNASSDVTFFPKLVELPGGASRNIRIGIKAGLARDVEQSFRLFIEELPDQSAPAANAVALRTKMGIPVFVRPVKPDRTAVLESVSVESGKVLTRVRNTGNLHISVDTIAIKGTGASNAPTFSKQGPGWYVLPGATRIFEVPLTAAECGSTTAVAVEVFGHNTSLKGAGQVSPAACAGALGLVAAAWIFAAAPAAAQERSIWALVVNEEAKGDIEIILTPDGPWVDPSALVAAGIREYLTAGARYSRRKPISRVLLGSLAPQITFTLDEAEIRVIISADPSLLSATELASPTRARPDGRSPRTMPSS